jgi:hypothetical protein
MMLSQLWVWFVLQWLWVDRWYWRWSAKSGRSLALLTLSYQKADRLWSWV